MLNTSKDILNIILALSAGMLTIFICWVLYYVATTIKNAKEMVENINNKIKKIDMLIDTIQEKIDRTSSNIGLITEIIKKGIGMVGVFQEKCDKYKGKKK
jgi:peptidoglycan hydrolase CwlO-like protein